MVITNILDDLSFEDLEKAYKGENIIAADPIKEIASSNLEVIKEKASISPNAYKCKFENSDCNEKCAFFSTCTASHTVMWMPREHKNVIGERVAESKSIKQEYEQLTLFSDSTRGDKGIDEPDNVVNTIVESNMYPEMKENLVLKAVQDETDFKRKKIAEEYFEWLKADGFLERVIELYKSFAEKDSKVFAINNAQELVEYVNEQDHCFPTQKRAFYKYYLKYVKQLIKENKAWFIDIINEQKSTVPRA